MSKGKLVSLLYEIIRFGIVGFISFLFDWGTMMLALRVFLNSQPTASSIAISTTAGFVIGVMVNYLLSVKFVFKASAEKGYGKDYKSKAVFLIIAVIGLILTQVIMNVGVVQLLYNETVVKVGATFIVMIWNYISRKVFIFKD